MKYMSNDSINTIKQIIKTLINYIYPKNITCIICNNPIKLNNSYSLCKDCFEEVNFISDGCSKCGKSIITRNMERESLIHCNYRYNKKFYFDRVVSCVEYNETSKKIVFNLKYKNQTYLCKYIAGLLQEKIKREYIEVDYIVFVPLHKKRLRKRGFNQSQKIASHLGKLLDMPVINCIERTRNTKRLYNMNKEQREHELKNVFVVNNNINTIKNKKVILIDDIFTTGSTVNEISKILKINNVSYICVATFLNTVVDAYIQE